MVRRVRRQASGPLLVRNLTRSMLYIMPLADAPADWASHLGLVCPRYQENATTKAPGPTRLGEFAAGLLLASVLGVRADEQLSCMRQPRQLATLCVWRGLGIAPVSGRAT